MSVGSENIGLFRKFNPPCSTAFFSIGPNHSDDHMRFVPQIILIGSVFDNNVNVIMLSDFFQI